jgi:hypothetical protein
MKEVWKDIDGYEGLYQASINGEIKSLPKDHRYGSKVEKILKPRTKKENDYARVCLCKDGKVKSFRRARLIAITFIPNPENKYSVNHINGIKSDDRIENLEWATASEQNYHMWETGLITISDKWRQAMKANIGKKHSVETKEKIRKKAIGRIVTDETKLKLTIAGKGRIVSEITKEKLRKKQLGKYLTTEAKLKISNANKGKTPWNKGMKKQQEYEYRMAKNN